MDPHPLVELVTLYQQLSSNAVMGQRMRSVHQAIPKPADRAAGIPCKRPQVEIVGFDQIAVMQGTSRALRYRTTCGGKPFQCADLILLSRRHRRSPGQLISHPGLLGCVLKPHTGAVTDRIKIREHSERVVAKFLPVRLRRSFLSLSFLSLSILCLF